MLLLRPLAAVQNSSGLAARIPREFLALATTKEPWTGYAAFTADGIAVGICAFKGAPTKMRVVEIAYMTFPEHEGRVYGATMARSLFEIAAGSGEVVCVIAHTLREENASVRICRRLGFSFEGEVDVPEDGLVWRWRKPTGLSNHL